MSTSHVHVRWDDADTSALVPGITAATLAGTRLSATRFVLDPGADVPEHSHDSEEFGHVVRGGLELRCEGVTTTLREGDAFVVPGGVPHAARALDAGCELLECYTPPRVPAAPAAPSSPASTGDTP
jgi:quercetin dioxygenase-like cupin family protein